MKMTYRVKYSDGREVEATAKPVDIMAFERVYRVSFMQFSEENPMEHAWFLAWAPLKRTGQDPRDFDAFMADVDSIEVVPEEPPGPTKKARSAGRSPS
jgi:hypothetical protein